MFENFAKFLVTLTLCLFAFLTPSSPLPTPKHKCAHVCMDTHSHMHTHTHTPGSSREEPVVTTRRRPLRLSRGRQALAGLWRLDPGPCPRAVPAPRPSAETQPSTDRERPGAEGNSSRCASAPAGRNNVFFLFTHFAEASARLAPQGGGEVRAPRPVSSRLTRHVLRVLSLGVQPGPPSPPNRPPSCFRPSWRVGALGRNSWPPRSTG